MFEVIRVERAFAVINGAEMKLNFQRSQEATLTITARSFPHPQTTFPLNSVYFARQIFLCGQIWQPSMIKTTDIWVLGT